MKKQNLIILLGFFSLLFSCKTYKLPDAKLKPSKVCGADVCQPGNIGSVFQFYKKPFALEVDNIKSMKDIATSVIGHTFPANRKYVDRALTCSFITASPFLTQDVVNLVNPTGRNFDYLKTSLLDLNVKATVDGNMEQIRNLNPGNENLQKVEARLTAAYNKLNNKVLTVQGKYSEWGLGKDAIEKLIKGDGFQECKKFLTENKYRIITAIGMVYFDITFDETNLDKVAADLQSEISTLYGIKGDLAVSFKREVTRKLKASTNGGYQIVVWRHVGAEDLSY